MTVPRTAGRRQVTPATGGAVAHELWALLSIAQRDVTKLLRDRPRLAVNLAFPILLVAGLGSVLQPTVGRVTGLNAVGLAFSACWPRPCSSPPRPG